MKKRQSIELYAGCNGTYKCMSLGNAPSSGGIWPLIELLFIWLQLENIHENMQEGEEFVPKEESTYKCLTVAKFANDLGSGPDIWFMSSWNLVMLGRLPSSSGKGPDIWFPLKSLRIENGIVTICHAMILVYITHTHKEISCFPISESRSLTNLGHLFW